MKTVPISLLSRIMCFVAAAALVVSLFVPLWRIELDAPQYPEGLSLQIFPHKLGGNVDIINGLNHYIGMQTLHAENFIEFTILPYIIVFFAVMVLAAGIVGNRKFLKITLFSFVAFGIIAMVDFWRWEYNYGHDLDPNAAIVVPGMAYQPPLIGFKQLLNFGAYSIPDIGGWLFILCGLLLVAAVVYEGGLIKRWRNKAVVPILLFSIAAVCTGCQPAQPEPVKLHSDRCDHCKMAIADASFAAEAITTKGRIFKFDDVLCLNNYIEEHREQSFQSLWVAVFAPPHQFIDATKAFYIQSEELHSPMRGNLAAFISQKDADQQLTTIDGHLCSWGLIQKK